MTFIAYSLLGISCAISCGLWFATNAQAQSMADSIREPWKTYIFVSSNMPRASLVGLAREASVANATLVLRGFPDDKPDLGAMQSFVSGIDAACCMGSKGTGADAVAGSSRAASTPASWMIEPRLFERYKVTAVPTFVLAQGEGTRDQDFSRVEGDMALANALKFMAQESAQDRIVQRASALYMSAFERSH